MSIFLLSSWIWVKRGGRLSRDSRLPINPLALVGYSVLSILSLPIKGIPKSAVHESLTTEYLLIVSWALPIFVALLAKERLKVLSVKVIGSLTAEVF